jgi:hypothetical protein
MSISTVPYVEAELAEIPTTFEKLYVRRKQPGVVVVEACRGEPGGRQRHLPHLERRFQVIMALYSREAWTSFCLAGVLGTFRRDQHELYSCESAR